MIRNLSLAVALPLFLATAVPASTVWNFNGVCSDCPGNGTGVLTIDQQSPNDPLTFSFAYTSPWISYTMTSATASVNNVLFNGNSLVFPVTTGSFRLTQLVPITSVGGVGNPLPAGTYTDRTVFFETNPDGSWSTGSNSLNSDFGVSNSGGWTAAGQSGVPEPSSVALAVTGLALAAFGARRRKQAL
jgi:PEP-CTERM motif